MNLTPASSASCPSRPSSAPTPNQLNWEELWSIFSTRCSPDFTFVVGDKSTRLTSYKAFLIARSPQLAKLVENADTFYLEDMVPLIFYHFHEFLHTGKFTKNKELREEDLIKVLRFGAKYCPGRVEEAEMCRVIVQDRISLENVFKLNQQAKVYKLSVLEEITGVFISDIYKNPEKYIYTEAFLGMDAFSLSELLKSDELHCDEVKLFEAVLRWADNKPGPPSCAMLSLEQVKYHIRFPLMSSTYFADKVVPARILSDDDVLLLFMFICSSPDNKPELTQFNMHPRGVHSRKNTVSRNNSLREAEILEVIDIEPEIKMEVVKEESPPESPPPSPLPPPQVKSEYEEKERKNHENVDISTKSNITTKISEKNWDHFLQKLELHKNTSDLRVEIKSAESQAQIGKRFLLPNLTKVYLSLKIRPDRRKCKNPIESLRNNFELDPYIFWKIEKTEENSEETDLWQSGVEFEVVINGVKFFKISQAQKEIAIAFGGKSTNALLPKLANDNGTRLAPQYSKLSKLILVDTQLPVVPFPYDRLKEVLLWGVKDTSYSPQLNEFLQKLTSLEKLSCRVKRRMVLMPGKKGKMEKHREKNVINLGADLTSGNKLKRIAVCWAKLVVTQGHGWVNPVTVRKKGVTELYTDYCHWCPEIYDNFDKIFPNVERVAFGYCGTKLGIGEDESQGRFGGGGGGCVKRVKLEYDLISAVTVKLMLTIVKKCKKISWIRVAKLDWDMEPVDQADVDELRLFLQSAGLEVEVGVKKSDFILEKDTETGKWKGKLFKCRGYSEKHLLSQRYWEEMDKLEYDHFELNQVFQDFKTLRAYNVGP